MIRGGVVFSIMLASAQVGADSASALSYLKQMGLALQTLNYHGTIVYSHEGEVGSMQVIHQSGPGGEIERLVHLSGEPREIIRTNDVVTCYLPDSRSVLVANRNLNGHMLAKLSADYELFSNVYTFTVAGEGRIAGKRARLISVEPKDQYRYGYRLWLGVDAALLLKSELIGPRGNVLEQFMFAQVEIVDFIPDAMLKPAMSGESFAWYRDKSPDTGGAAIQLAHWGVSQLPVGFKLTEYTRQHMPNTDVSTDHLVISDGLAFISVYIEPIKPGSQPIVGPLRMGALNIHGALLGDFQVTVVGEVPPTTVKMIAESIVAPKIDVPKLDAPKISAPKMGGGG